jgi:hypothetical protein
MDGGSRPPVWAEAALRCLLPVRNRDTVSGDLLEEYRDVVVPGRGVVRANLWYLRQVVSFVAPALIRTKREASMRWIVFGTVSLAVLLVALVRSNLAPPVGLMVAVPLTLMLALTAVPSMRSRAELLPIARIAAWGGALVLAVLLVRVAVDVIAPVDVLDRFLAQARSDFSEFDYPRRWVPALAIALVLGGSGFLAARSTGRVGKGVLAAMGASVIGTASFILVGTLANMLPMGPVNHPSPDVQFFVSVPLMLTPVLGILSTVPGAIGGLFGRGLSGSRSQPG